MLFARGCATGSGSVAGPPNKWWDILALLAVTLTIAFISQRLQDNTPGLIVHYVFNGVSFVVFVLLVAGVVEI